MRKVKVEFDKDELWELICNFDAAYEPGPDNRLAERVSGKLHEARRKLDEAKK